MCRVGGPRCDSKWTKEHRAANNFKRRARRNGVYNGDGRIDRLAERISDPVETVSPSEIDPFMLDMSKEFFPDVSSFAEVGEESKISDDLDIPLESKRSIRKYSENMYRDVNSLLRRGRIAINQESGTPEMDEELAESDEVIKGLDDVLSDYDSGENTVCYRGFSPKGGQTVDDIVNAHKIGSVITDRGYVSTTTNQEIAKSFSRGYGKTRKNSKAPRVIYRMLTTRGMEISGMSGFSTESEVLIGRGHAFVVCDVHKDVPSATKESDGDEVKDVTEKITVIDLVDASMLKEPNLDDLDLDLDFDF